MDTLINIEVISNVDKSSLPSSSYTYQDYGHDTACIGAMGATGGNTKGIAGVAFGSHHMEVHYQGGGLLPACQGFNVPNCNGVADSLYLSRKLGAKIIIPEVAIQTCSAYSIEHLDPVVRTAIASNVGAGVSVFVPAGNSANLDVRILTKNGKALKMPDTGSVIVGALDTKATPSGISRPTTMCGSSSAKFNYGASSSDSSNPLYTDSSVGHGIDVSGPNPVYTTVIKDPLNLKYNEVWGTSTATPVVAGVAALMLSLRPDLTPLEIRKTLRETRGDATKPPLTDSTAGLVDAHEAVSRYTNSSTLVPGLYGKFYPSTIHLPVEPYLNTLAREYPDSSPPPDYPDLEPNQPLKTKVVSNLDMTEVGFDLFKVGLQTLFIAEFQGVLNIKAGESGSYEFIVGVNSDSGDGALLEIDNQKVVSTFDSVNPNNRNLITLTEGAHQIKVLMYDYPNSGLFAADRLRLVWKKPGSTQEEIIPAEAFTHSLANEVTPRNLKPGLVGRFYDYRNTFNSGDPRIILPEDQAEHIYLGSKIFKQLLFKESNEARLGFNRRGDTFGIGKSDDFLGYFTGFLKLPPGYQTGNYKFIVTHDDGMRLFLDGQEIISRPGPHDGTVSQATNRGLWLENGQPAPERLHEIAVAYNEIAGEAELHLAWEKPDGTIEEIPASAFVH